MLLLIALFLAIINFLSVGFLKFSSAEMMPMAQLMEMVNINVNCTTASVNVRVIVMSNVTSLVHFPEGAAIDDPDLINATSITLGFAGDFSVLMFTFENVSASTAKIYADDVKPSIESAFQTQFTYNSTEIHDDSVSVKYQADGKSDLVSYTDWLMDQCLNSTIGGFSSAFLEMASESTAMVSVICYKETGGFDWIYSIAVYYTTSISTGTGSHTIDVLDLLNVASLGPSQHALFEEFGYISTVNVAVNSNETIMFVGCVPPRITYPMSRGWYVPSDSGLTLTGTFYFGNDPSPAEELTFTFSGTVIPEINSLLPLITLLIVLASAMILKGKK